MSPSDIVTTRGISEVLHFTTNEGLVGILQTGAVLSRKRLPKESYLEYIYKPNCRIRKDVAWLDYVNLSLSWINPELFRICSHWHKDRDIWWCVLAFDASILEHEDVHFVTTNNMYTGAKQRTGGDGLEALFGKQIVQYVEWRNGQKVPTKWATRPRLQPPRLPTCSQAEVLYPGALSLDFLRGVYVPSQELAYRVQATSEAVSNSALEVWVKPEMFEGEAPEEEP